VRDQSGAVLSSRTVHFRYASGDDAERILELRRAPSRAGMLSATPDDVGAQQRWLAEYRRRHADGLEHYFLIANSSGAGIGTARVHDVTQSSCWWGSWVVDAGSPIGVSLESYVMINFFMFEVLKVHEAHFRVRRANLPVLRFHDSMGSRRATELDDEIQYLADAAWYAGFRRKHDAHFAMIKCSKDLGL